MEKVLAMLKMHSASAKRRADMYGDIAQISDNKMRNDISSLQRSPKAGKHMQKIGFIMMWIPEPTGVTCAVGAPMVLAGRYLDKRNGGSISDLAIGTKSALEGVSNVRNSMI
ncbi:MAG: hypothetical protein K8823_621 [Cenarchaeum symbiont of Oopsacas minuta]|nr:hypothetical protein [Cenarchaeum symbiont of Oopsacas minuta]